MKKLKIVIVPVLLLALVVGMFFTGNFKIKAALPYGDGKTWTSVSYGDTITITEENASSTYFYLDINRINSSGTLSTSDELDMFSISIDGYNPNTNADYTFKEIVGFNTFSNCLVYLNLNFVDKDIYEALKVADYDITTNTLTTTRNNGTVSFEEMFSYVLTATNQETKTIDYPVTVNIDNMPISYAGNVYYAQPVVPVSATVSKNATNGSISGNVSGLMTGDTVELTAVPNRGYRFTSWSVEGGTLSSTSSLTTTLTITNASVSVTANFEEVEPSKVEVTATNGTTTGLIESLYIGDTVTITANANSGYKFSKWVVTGATIDNANSTTTTITITSETVNVEAVFVEYVSSSLVGAFFRSLGSAVTGATSVVVVPLVSMFTNLFLVTSDGAVVGITPIAYIVIISIGISLAGGLCALSISLFRRSNG